MVGSLTGGAHRLRRGITTTLSFTYSLESHRNSQFLSKNTSLLPDSLQSPLFLAMLRIDLQYVKSQGTNPALTIVVTCFHEQKLGKNCASVFCLLKRFLLKVDSVHCRRTEIYLKNTGNIYKRLGCCLHSCLNLCINIFHSGRGTCIPRPLSPMRSQDFPILGSL